MGAAFLGPPFLDRLALLASRTGAHPRRRSLWTARVGGLNQGFDFPNLCSHDPTDRFSLARMEPVLEIAVVVALRTARAFSATMHPAPAPVSYRRLPAGMTGAGLCPTSASFGHIRQSSRHIRLTHGVVCHFWSPPSRSPALTIPTTPWAPACISTCRTSTVCLWPRRCRSRA